MKRYVDKGRKKTEVWKKGDRVLLSTKDLVFKERPSKKLIERYRTVHDRRGGIVECGEIVIAKFDKDTSGSKRKPDSEIQGTGEGAEERGKKTSRDRGN